MRILLLSFFIFYQIKGYSANPSVTTINATIPALVQISGMTDIILSPISFDNPITASTSVCIYTNVLSPLGSYYVTATSANASAGNFRVLNGTNSIVYQAWWNNSASASQSFSLTSGTKSTQLTGANDSALNCNGNPNANFNIQFSSAELSGAPPAVYTDTVTLLISPS